LSLDVFYVVMQRGLSYYGEISCLLVFSPPADSNLQTPAEKLPCQISLESAGWPFTDVKQEPLSQPVVVLPGHFWRWTVAAPLHACWPYLQRRSAAELLSTTVLFMGTFLLLFSHLPKTVCLGEGH